MKAISQWDSLLSDGSSLGQVGIKVVSICTFILLRGTYCSTTQKSEGSLGEVNSSLQTCGCQGSISGHHAWWQETLPTVPSQRPWFNFCMVFPFSPPASTHAHSQQMTHCRWRSRRLGMWVPVMHAGFSGYNLALALTGLAWANSSWLGFLPCKIEKR